VNGWQEDALCAVTDPDAFNADWGDNGALKRAKSICGMCTVRLQCLEYALTNREMYGIWGGMSAKQRSELLRERAA
jgi:WhiB family redox-sensing transcriptional regulator